MDRNWTGYNGSNTFNAIGTRCCKREIEKEKRRERVQELRVTCEFCYSVEIYRTLESWGKCFELATETFLVVNAPTGSTYLILHGIKPVVCKHILSVKCLLWNKRLKDEIFWGKKISFSNWIHHSSTRSKRVFFRFLNFSFTMYCLTI